MKKLMLFLILFPLFCQAQEFNEIIDVPDKTAPQLYTSAKEWFAISFKSANNVIQMDDPANGKMIGKGSTTIVEPYTLPGIVRITCSLTFNIDFTVTIAVKDKKYKVDITDLIINPSAQAAGGSYKHPSQTYADILKAKDGYKDGMDPQKVKPKTANVLNGAYYNIICRTDEEMKTLLRSLETKMKKTEANW